MADTKISGATDVGILLATDILPVARSGSSTAYRATGTEVQTFVRTGDISGGSAAAGIIGEYLSAVVTTAVTLATGITSNVATLALTAGDWNVQGEVWLLIGAGGATQLEAGISTTSGVIATAPGIGTARVTVAGASLSTAAVLPMGPTRISLSASGTAYLMANLVFPSGTCTATGVISARRAR